MTVLTQAKVFMALTRAGERGGEFWVYFEERDKILLTDCCGSGQGREERLRKS